MKINLLSGTTYLPSRVQEKATPPSAKARESAGNIDKACIFQDVVWENLSPDEVNAIRKLFGDFKLGGNDQMNSIGGSSRESHEDIKLGRFVDIVA